jgi:hypothetical protein
MDSRNLCGLSAGMAQAILGQAAKNLVSAGTTQNGALALGVGISHFSTTAASSGARLPPMNAGERCVIYNSGANALTVYPDFGAQINGLSANAGFSVGAGKGAIFEAIDAKLALAVLSA